MGLLLVWLAFGLVAALIGSKKGEGGLGFLVGVLLGPFGILAAIMSKGNRRACPHCREMIQQDAKVCPKCQRDQPATPVEAERPRPLQSGIWQCPKCEGHYRTSLKTCPRCAP